MNSENMIFIYIVSTHEEGVPEVVVILVSN